MVTASLIIWLTAANHPTNAFDLPLAPARFAWSSPLAQRNDLYGVKGTPDGAHIWAVGAAGTVLSLHGKDAALEATGTEHDLYDLWVVAKDDVWIVGERGTILHGNGKTWSRVQSGTTQALHSIWGRDAHDLWIGGGGGIVLRREGDRWRTVPLSDEGTDREHRRVRRRRGVRGDAGELASLHRHVRPPLPRSRRRLPPGRAAGAGRRSDPPLVGG